MNTLAYRSLALDFDIWARTRQEIQQLHLDHFELLLVNSKYTNFNAKQRLAKFGIVRKLLFVLQTDWYSHELSNQLIKTLKTVAQACFFSADDTVKPLVSYLAANLHEGTDFPRSIFLLLQSSVQLRIQHPRQGQLCPERTACTVVKRPKRFWDS